MSENNNSNEDILWSYHPDRQDAIDEVHARPSIDIVAPAIILHIAFTCDKSEITKLFTKISGSKSVEIRRHVMNKIEDVDVKIERHTEFTSLTFIQNNASAADHSKIDRIYREYLKAHEVKILSKCKIILVDNAKDLAKQNSFGKRIFGGIMRGEMQVHSTLETDDHNNIVYAAMIKDSGSNELGRRIQRLYELETYRIMALIGLPLARRISTELSTLEDELNALTTLLETSPKSDDLDDQKLFQQLTNLSGKLDGLRSKTRFRFSASNAYFDIVDARMKTLIERELGDMQTISGFLRSRLEPARATIVSVENRLKILTDDITRALALLRTRIDIELSQGNQALLKSLDGRHRQQLLLSQAVEGLSSIAITYYAVSLLSYFLKAIDKTGQLPLNSTIIVAIAVPVILFTVWFAIRRLRIKLHKNDN